MYKLSTDTDIIQCLKSQLRYQAGKKGQHKTTNNYTGLPRIREKGVKRRGNLLSFFQGQGIFREFYKLSGKLGIVDKCQGILKIPCSSTVTE